MSELPQVSNIDEISLFELFEILWGREMVAGRLCGIGAGFGRHFHFI